ATAQTTMLTTQVCCTPNLFAMQAMVAKLVPALDWRHHGIGVLQAYVSANVRVHIWHDRLLLSGMRESGAIHDHRFRLESTILVGALTNREYSLSTGDEPTYADYETYQVTKIGRAGSCNLEKTSGRL